MTNDQARPVATWKKVTGLIILIVPVAFAAVWCIVSYLKTPPGGAVDFYTGFIFRNYVTFFLIPYAAFFALYLVSILESTNGPIEIEFMGLKVKGAGGPIMFWVLIFLSAVLALKLLWIPPDNQSPKEQKSAIQLQIGPTEEAT